MGSTPVPFQRILLLLPTLLFVIFPPHLADSKEPGGAGRLIRREELLNAKQTWLASALHLTFSLDHKFPALIGPSTSRRTRPRRRPICPEPSKPVRGSCFRRRSHPTTPSFRPCEPMRLRIRASCQLPPNSPPVAALWLRMEHPLPTTGFM